MSFFLDLSMPVMDGWEFLKEYALLKPNIKKEISLYIVFLFDLAAGSGAVEELLPWWPIFSSSRGAGEDRRDHDRCE